MKVIFNKFLYVVFFFIFSINILTAAPVNDTLNFISDKLYVSIQEVGNYEIDQINFIGNSFFSKEELSEYVSSKSSNISFVHQRLLNIYKQLKINNSVISKYLIPKVETALKSFKSEYSYFNQEVAVLDIDILKNLYHVNGFHFPNIYYQFVPDTIQHINVLNFYIDEKEHYKISSLEYKGLDNLSDRSKNRIETYRTIKPGDYFNEQDIETEMTRINSSLLNIGYMYSKWDYPNVVMDSTVYTDSIVGYFDVGKRIKIGNLIFVDSTNNQKKVAHSTKEKIMILKSGDYYSKRRIDRSIEYLLSMGTFESVSIDTLNRDYDPNDDTRDFVIRCNYRKLKEWDVGLFIDQTQIDNLVNVGANASIRHRNLFGSAQRGELFANFSFKDLNHVLSNWRFPDYEFKLGVSYTQPLLWKLNNSRIAFTTGMIYSLETISDLFKVASLSIPVKFPAKLSRTSYFSNIQIEFNFDRENPYNYNSVLGYALDSARTQQDTNNILRAFTLYDNIYNYLNEPETHLFTSNILSISLTGDNRNHPFSPTKGHFSYIGIDGLNVFLSHNYISGNAKYFRGQLIHNNYIDVSSFGVLALKGKIGTTYLMDQEYAFVPLERQFFAGGANSVRAWRARELRYHNPEILDEIADDNTKYYITNYIGSRTLIEGSIEYRRCLSDIMVNQSLQWLMNNLWTTVFIDFGNAFGWYYEDNNDKAMNVKWSDYITKLAVASGIGIRYETPVGPIRIDLAFPVYDPLKQRRFFGDCTVHFGIGHAF